MKGSDKYFLILTLSCYTFILCYAYVCCFWLHQLNYRLYSIQMPVLLVVRAVVNCSARWGMGMGSLFMILGCTVRGGGAEIPRDPPQFNLWWREASRHCLVSRQYFNCLWSWSWVLTKLTLIVSVLPLLSWSCASRPRQFTWWIAPATYRLIRNPAADGKVLGNDQSKTLTKMNSRL